VLEGSGGGKEGLMEAISGQVAEQVAGKESRLSSLLKRKKTKNIAPVFAPLLLSLHLQLTFHLRQQGMEIQAN
jgi:hypothetical protein